MNKYNISSAELLRCMTHDKITIGKAKEIIKRDFGMYPRNYVDYIDGIAIKSKIRINTNEEQYINMHTYNKKNTYKGEEDGFYMCIIPLLNKKVYNQKWFH